MATVRTKIGTNRDGNPYLLLEISNIEEAETMEILEDWGSWY